VIPKRTLFLPEMAENNVSLAPLGRNSSPDVMSSDSWSFGVVESIHDRESWTTHMGVESVQ
jgi:hypothetical protein